MNIYYSKMNMTPSQRIASDMGVIRFEFGSKCLLFHTAGEKYSDKILLKANIVIVTGWNSPHVGRGVHTEVLLALKNNIPVFQFVDGDSGKLYRVLDSTTDDTSDHYKRYGILHYEYQDYEDDDNDFDNDDDDLKLYTYAKVKELTHWIGDNSNEETNLLY